MADLLSVKKQKKAKNPRFIRQDAHKKKRVGSNWRKPRGITSKMRLHLQGHRPVVKPGFGTPAVLRGANRVGLFPVKVHSSAELDAVDPKKQGIMIASSVGKKKRMDIIAKAADKKIQLLNIKDSAKYVKDIEAAFAKKKEAGKEKKADKEKRQKELEKKAEQKEKEDKEKKEKESKVENIEEALEEKEKKEEQEKNKVLTKKEM